MKKSWFYQLLWITLFAIFLSWASNSSLLRDAENWIEERRFALTPAAAQGQYVFLGIDSESINEIGVWPWPRAVHAEVINRLTAMNVREIGVDIDFSSRSNNQNDQQLAQAFANSNGIVTLPIFVQDRSARLEDDHLIASRPLPEFEAVTWLATVNVVADHDGVIRRFPSSITIDGEDIPSLPVALSGYANQFSGDVNINYSINPNTIPAYSVADLLAGKILANQLEDKTVIYGAQAVELRDNFAVPTHGILPGAVVQILAAETLTQNINVRSIGTHWTFVALFTAIAGVAIGLARRSVAARIGALLVLSLSVELTAFYVFKEFAFSVQTAGLHLLIFVSASLITLLEVDLQSFRALFEKTDKKNAQRLLNQVFDDNVCGILVLDADGNILKHNVRALSFFSSDKEGTLETWASLPPELAEAVRSSLSLSDKALSGELEHRCSSGKILTLEYAAALSTLKKLSGHSKESQVDEKIVCLTVWDITARREQEKKLKYLARFDVLTGALRRAAFEDELLVQGPSTVFAINIHRFKTININLGRSVGDEVLLEAVERLKLLDDEICHVARLGGDSFAFSIDRRLEVNECEKIGGRIVANLSNPFIIGKAEIHVGVRVGAAATSNSIEGDVVLQAEMALDEARQTQGNAVHIHQAKLSEKQARARRIEADLWRALERDEFWLSYQPQVSIDDEMLVGAEALVRWDHSELGFISPADFIDIAEANGFVDELGEWVLNKACQDALSLPEHLTVAVNVSPAQFMRSNIPNLVESALERTGLPSNRLHLEITEVGFLEATHTVINDLRKLDEMGICLALDDFGTGFSSLGYFANFPIRKIKVDQMFIRTLERDSDNEAIVRSVKALSQGLGLKMICEGVETEEQLGLLKEIGVHEGQGYLFGKPQNIHSLIALTEVREKLRA